MSTEEEEITHNEQGNVTSERFDGRCKWFNNKAGYGFITASSGPHSGEDVFVHHSSLTVIEEQYKYLVQGEYVEFKWSETDGEGTHKWQATDVRGVKGGKLMCETRNETREARTKSGDTERRPPRHSHGWKSAEDAEERDWPPRGSQRGPRRGGRGPRSMHDENGVEWLMVRKRGSDGGGKGGRRPRDYDDDA